MTIRTKAFLSLLFTSAVWGIAGPVIKYTLGFIPPFTFLFYRFLISSIFILPVFLPYLQKNPVGKRDALILTFLALLSTTLNLSLIFLGFERTTALDGTLIGALTPIFIVLGGALFLGEKVSRLEKIGLTIAIGGTLVTIIQPFLENAAFAGENTLGNLLILLSGFEWAAFTLIAKNDLKKYSPFLLTAWASFVALISFLPLAYLENPDFLSLQQALIIFSNLNSFLDIIYMALLSYLLANYFYFYGLKSIEASESAIFAYLQPLFAAPFAVIFLKEAVTFPFLAGALVTALGVFLTEYHPRARFSGKTAA